MELRYGGLRRGWGAIRLGVPLVSNDGIFREAPGLVLETAP